MNGGVVGGKKFTRPKAAAAAAAADLIGRQIDRSWS